MAEDELDIGPLQIEDDAATTTGHKVRFGSAATGGTSVKGGVTVSSRRDGPNYIVRFVNQGTASVWTVTKDGKPSVQIVPQKRAADPAQRWYAWYNTTSQSYYGRQVYQAPATDWVQQRQVASDLSHAMLDAGRYPVPVLGEVDVLHDPRLQLGDVVRVVDTTGAALDTLAWIVGIRTTCQAGSVPQQTLTLRGTSYNGVPLDSGLTPDPPVDPQYGTRRSYALVAAQFPTLDDLTKSRLSYRELLQPPGGAA
jgi:antitoxin (DNA-binding transcriptional repressor) of toxin-antitoxin stability system